MLSAVGREYLLKSFEFQLPTRIVFGFGASDGVGQEAKAFQPKCALVITDQGVANAGILDRVTSNLETEGVKFAVFSEVSPNPRDVEVEAGVGFAREHDCDLLVAVGGGSVIDCAKAIGTLLTHGGKVQDYEGLGKLVKPISPLIVVPTTHGTGSEVTFWYVITDEKAKRKVDGGSPLMAARVALVDPELTLSLPPSLTAATGLDALTHAVEAYTGLPSEPLTDSLALTAIELIGRSLRQAYANGGNREARYDVTLGSVLAGVAFGNSDVGAVHCISETLGGFYDIPHGVANAVYLPIVVEYNLIAAPERFARVACALGASPAGLSPLASGRELVATLEQLNRDLGIPSAREAGVKDEDLPALADLCARNVSVESNARVMTQDGFLHLLKVGQGR
jgi:alcohol dehydrogenase